MAITYIAGMKAGNASGGNLTVTKDGAVQDGHILIATCYNEIGAAAWTPPAGWTQYGTGQINFDGNAWVNVYWKRASGEGASWTFNIATTWRTIVIAAFSGCLASGDPIDVGPTGKNENLSNPSVDTQTTVADGAMMLACHGNFSGATLSYSSGTVLTQGANAFLGGCEIWYGIKTPAGATGSTTWTGTMGAGEWASYHLAIKPAAAGQSAIGINEPVAEFQSTLNQASYAMGAYTPLPWSLQVVMVFADGTVAAAPTMTGGSLVWTRRQRIVYNTTDMACIFTAPVGASPVSTNPTFDCTGDNATGVVMMAFQVIGYNQASPIAQSDSEARTAANPVDTLPGNMGTNNGYMAGFGMPRNPPSATQPTSWTLIADTGHANPTAGAAGAFRVNGETGTTITFTSASAAYGIVAIEIAVTGDITPQAIASAGVMGSPTVQFTVVPISIASGEVVGSPTVQFTIVPIGIASAGALGSPTVEFGIVPIGIASAEAAGSPTIQATVVPIGITSAEATGSPTIETTIVSIGIASAEVFGSPSSTAVVDAQGIASAEVFGLPTVTTGVTYDIYPIGIDSAEVVGTPTVFIVVDSQGIVSSETVGSPVAILVVSPDGVITSEAQGIPSTTVVIDAQGIVSGEASGSPTITSDITAQAIASAETIGQPTIASVLQVLGIASAEEIGQPAAAVSVQADGIVGAETFGLPTVSETITYDIYPIGIAGGEAFGTPTIDTGVIAIGVSSGELVGTPAIAVNAILLGVASDEHIGSPIAVVNVNLTGISSGEFVGQPSLAGVLEPQGIIGGEAFGLPTLTWAGWTIQAIGIAGAEAFGKPTVAFTPIPPTARESTRPMSRLVTLEEDEDDVILAMMHGLIV